MKKQIYSLMTFAVCLFSNYQCLGQADILNHSRFTGFYLGWDNTGFAGPLDIKNGFVDNIDFYIGAGGTPWLQLLASGDLNIVTGDKGYQIDGNYVLRHNNITSSIYLGVNAGNANANTFDNTFLGYNTGTAIGNSIIIYRVIHLLPYSP